MAVLQVLGLSASTSSRGESKQSTRLVKLRPGRQTSFGFFETLYCLQPRWGYPSDSPLEILNVAFISENLARTNPMSFSDSWTSVHFDYQLVAEEVTTAESVRLKFPDGSTTFVYRAIFSLEPLKPHSRLRAAQCLP